MLQRICKLVAPDSSNSLIQVADESCLKFLEERFIKCADFFKFEYAQQHVKNSSQIRGNDSRFILGVPNQQSSGHMNNGCAVCDEIFFIPNDLKHIVTSLSTANVSQTVREEISTMIPACDLLNFELMGYATHQVRGKHQENEIKLIHERIADPQSNTAVIIMDHKKKVLPMRYREGQVHFFGKRGFSLLGILVSFRDQSKFYDVVVQGFSTQNAFQVQSIVQYVRKLIKSDFPLVSRIIIQSDNASAYSCANHIRFVYQLNIYRPYFTTIVLWVNSEAQKGKTRLDCHFSYVDLRFRKFVQARNEILTGVDIFDALKLDSGIRGTTAILLDMRSVNRPFKTVPAFQVNSSISQIHDIVWKMDEKKIELRYFTSHDPYEIILESRKPSLMASGVISDRECVSSRFDHIGFPASQSIRSNSGRAITLQILFGRKRLSLFCLQLSI